MIVDHVHSGDHGKAGPSALLIVVKGTGLGPESVYQGMMGNEQYTASTDMLTHQLQGRTLYWRGHAEGSM